MYTSIPPETTQQTRASSPYAARALDVFTTLQARFADGINSLSERYADGSALRSTAWLRDGGAHGGGWRREDTMRGVLNRGSLNISSVHYDDLPEKRLSSATALSCIIHPRHPRAPSLHTHISWTELRDGTGGWRLMADLNPSLVVEAQRDRFSREVEESLIELNAEQRRHAREQGDRYFWIPTLKRHRGVAHFYLEQWNSGDFETDLTLATRFGQRVIDTYLDIFDTSLSASPQGERAPSAVERQAQLKYHSAYFLQVLTLDRGTSSGLLVHDQNDVGILGSLPQQVSRAQLRAWVKLQPQPQDELLTRLIDALPRDQSADDLQLKAEVATLTPAVRAHLAEIVRQHYRAHPEALALQARGDVLPPTVAHHQNSR